MSSPQEKDHKYYLRGEVVNFEEDQTHEFKGHRNISIGEVPPWCINKKDNTKTRNAASRNICAFLNAGIGGTVYIGILDGGIVKGVRLTQYQQDHLLLSLQDSLGNFSPPVPRFMYQTDFFPVLDPGDPYPTEFFVCPEEVRSEPHYLRSYKLCWCDYDSLGQFHNGIIPMAYVVEITIPPVDSHDPRVQALMPGLKIPTLPVFQCEDGQAYFRQHSSIVTYSMTDIANQAKEEVQLLKMPELMKAWKKWKTCNRLLELVKKTVSQQEKAEKTTSESPGGQETEVSSEMPNPESPGGQETEVSSEMPNPESPGGQETEVSSEMPNPESPGGQETEVSSEMPNPESPGGQETEVSSEMPNPESPGGQETEVSSEMPNPESPGGQETEVSSEMPNPESPGGQETEVSSEMPNSESPGGQETEVSSEMPNPESPGGQETEVSSEMPNPESPGGQETEVSSEMPNPESPGGQETEVSSEMPNPESPGGQ